MAYSCYYKTRLTAVERVIYDTVLEGFFKQKKAIQIPRCTADEISRVMKALNYDEPLLFFVKFSDYLVKFYGNRCSVEVSFSCTAAERAQFEAKLKTVTAGIVQKAARVPQNERSLYLHDYLIKNARYAKPADNWYAAHTILGPLIYGECVCEGYSKAYKYLCDACRIASLVVDGKADGALAGTGAHAWNIVRLDGATYHVDVTFDLVDGERACSHAYYLRSTKEICVNHQINTDFPIPDCPTNKSILPLVRSTSGLIAFLKAESNKGLPCSEVRLSKAMETGEIMRLVQDKITPLDFIWYNRISAFSSGGVAKTLRVIWR